MTFLGRLTRLALRVSTLVGAHRAILQFVFGSLALVLGFWGWSIKSPLHDLAGFANNFFRTLQLITLHFPTDFEGDIPLQLQIARLLVPLVAVSATFHILLGGVTRPLRLAMLTHTRDHVILIGDEEMSEAALNALVAENRHVVSVAAEFDSSRRETLEGLGLTVAESDPKQSATFKTLNLEEAGGLFVLGPDDLDNINLSMLAIRALAGRRAPQPPLALAVQVDREDLATELDAVLDGVARRRGVRYHRICSDRDGLRIELARSVPVFTKPDRNAPSHVLIVGLQGRWQQALSQIVVAVQDHPTQRPIVSLALTTGERDALARWRAVHPDLDLIVRFELLERDAQGLPTDEAAAAWLTALGPPHLVVVLLDGADAISGALALRRPSSGFGTEKAPILVRQSKEDFLLSALSETEDRTCAHGRIAPFSGPIRAESVARILNRKGDEIAMALHAHYLDTTKRVPPGSPAAVAAWDDLPENLRDANRASADHMAILFASEGLALSDGAGLRRAVKDASTLDRLARVEHRRWMADRIERGWRYGAARDDARRIHPSLRDFDMLAASEQEKDREQVKALAQVAAQIQT